MIEVCLTLLNDQYSVEETIHSMKEKEEHRSFNQLCTTMKRYQKSFLIQINNIFNAPYVIALFTHINKCDFNQSMHATFMIHLIFH